MFLCSLLTYRWDWLYTRLTC